MHNHCRIGSVGSHVVVGLSPSKTDMHLSGLLRDARVSSGLPQERKAVIARLINIWRLKRELKANLAARKRLRPIRQQAARKGWETRKAKA